MVFSSQENTQPSHEDGYPEIPFSSSDSDTVVDDAVGVTGTDLPR